MTTETVAIPGILAGVGAVVQTPCTHCGLTVPPGLIEPGAERHFCCHGCATAYEVIHGCGLDRYYRLRESTPGAPVKSTGKKYSEFDDAVFQGLYWRDMGGTLRSVDLFLEGVHCAACVWLVEKLPSVVKGVVEARLDVRRSMVRVVWDSSLVTLSRVAGVLDSLGYAAHPARDSTARGLRRVEDRRHLIRLGVAGACAGNVMLLAFALYAGLFDTMEEQYRHLFRWMSMGFSVLSLAWPGRVFFRGAWAAIITRTMHLDLPISLGLAAGAVAGIVNTLRGTGEIYFDSLSVLVFALLIGRWIQHRQTRWAGDAVELLFSLTPTSARLVENGTVREVSIESVRIGQIVEVRAGDSVPVDGDVTEGSSEVDQSILTGESRPVPVVVGDGVCAGAVNLSGLLRVRVGATGPGTRAGKLMRLVEECSRRRAPIVRLADRIAGYFLGGMVTLAAITAVVWLRLEPARALDNAAALLIVTCPCALGLATPLAMTVAIGRAARRGVLVKGGDALQQLAKAPHLPGTIFLDKTGTITQGRLSLATWIGDEESKPLAAAVEARSSHPIARALVRDLAEGLSAAGSATASRSDAPPPLPVTAVETMGGGIAGVAAGHEVLVGSPAFVRGRGASIDAPMELAEQEVLDRGLTPVLVAVDGRVDAVAGLGDAVRPEAREAVASLKGLGWRVAVLSGDHPDLVRRVGRELGIDDKDLRGGVSPEAKLVEVQSAHGTVVMVGDGVNDAAALAAASVGIAVHGGAEASLAAADIYLSRPGLSAVAEVVVGARRTMRTIRVNLGVSLVYNAVAAALAVTGVISPLIAAVLMPASSLTVLALSFRARAFRAGGV